MSFTACIFHHIFCHTFQHGSMLLKMFIPAFWSGGGISKITYITSHKAFEGIHTNRQRIEGSTQVSVWGGFYMCQNELPVLFPVLPVLTDWPQSGWHFGLKVIWHGLWPNHNHYPLSFPAGPFHGFSHSGMLAESFFLSSCCVLWMWNDNTALHHTTITSKLSRLLFPLEQAMLLSYIQVSSILISYISNTSNLTFNLKRLQYRYCL